MRRCSLAKANANWHSWGQKLWVGTPAAGDAAIAGACGSVTDADGDGCAAAAGWR